MFKKLLSYTFILSIVFNMLVLPVNAEDEAVITTSAGIVKKTLLSLDTPEEFENLGLDCFESYTEGEISGAKLKHSVTTTDEETYQTSNKPTDNISIPFKENAYALGDITYEMKVFVEASKAVGATAVSNSTFMPKLIASKATTILPYVNNTTYAYQNQTERHDGVYTRVSKTEQRGSWHTYKTVLHTNTKTADIYIDGDLINTYKFNDYYGLAASGYYTRLQFDYTVGAKSDGLVYANTPYVLIDYIKITQEYETNRTGLYVLLNEIQEYGYIPGSSNRQGWFKALGISEGENVRAYTSVLNLTGKTISGDFLGAVYNGEQMSEGDGMSVEAENGEVLNGAVELTVSDISDMEIKAILWDLNLCPITAPAIADSTIAE